MTPLHRAWTDGVIAGLREHSWWKDGVQVVGRYGMDDQQYVSSGGAILSEAIALAESVWADEPDTEHGADVVCDTCRKTSRYIPGRGVWECPYCCREEVPW